MEFTWLFVECRLLQGLRLRLTEGGLSGLVTEEVIFRMLEATDHKLIYMVSSLLGSLVDNCCRYLGTPPVISVFVNFVQLIN